MNFDVAFLSDPELFQQNRLPAHSDHRWFASRAEAAAGESSFDTCLNGSWKFHYATNPAATIAGFEQTGFDTSTWDDIPVPMHIQLAGYDRPQYANVQYPWDGRESLETGQPPMRFNPVGSYVKTFTAPELAEDERLSVVFHGAESALAVWLNGHYIGYSTDSFTPSEFDLTAALVPGENKLAAQVFKWCAHSWLEDQDFFRFSGLFRDVELRRRPGVHLEDVRVRTELSDDLSHASIRVQPTLVGEGRLRVTLEGVGELRPEGDGFVVELDQPHLWSAEDPHLYDLSIEVLDGERVVEFVPQKVGVRRFGLADGVFRINNQRIVFTGVNRHDFGPQGRVMSREQTEADVRLLKQVNANSVRTSHYPNNSWLYELCDQYGLYVIDEMNLETHGIWDVFKDDDPKPYEESLPGDRPQWREVLLDRANSMVQRDKNHPSIVFWSCGNESYGGENLLAVTELFHQLDDRPVHYEGVAWDERYPETTDVRSEMYTPAADIEAYLETHRDKPFILCEYAHAMGNSFGAVDKYLDLAYRDELFQGAFIWDFADQAIRLRDVNGREFWGYGGDCGEAPHDAEFCGNGIVTADRGWTPKIPEVSYLYQKLRGTITDGVLHLENRHLFTNSSAFDAVVTTSREGRVLSREPLATDVAPLSSGEYPLPALPEVPGEYSIDVSFRLREATGWAEAGHEVAHEQAVVRVGAEAPTDRGPRPELVIGRHNIGVRGEGFEVLFSKLYGGLVSYRCGTGPSGPRELLKASPKPNFWHAPTSNEKGWLMGHVDGQWLLASRYARPDGAPTVAEGDRTLTVTQGYLLPTVPESRCTVAYEVHGDGQVDVTAVLEPGEGLGDAPEFGLQFVVPLLDELRWYGQGPAESYVDRCSGTTLGVWSGRVRDQLTEYLKPQEAGNHTGVRWAEVTDERGRGLRFASQTPMDFSALPWTPMEVEEAAHHTELPPITRTVIRPALMRRGVGGDNSWGARTHPEYCLPEGRLEFRFSFRGI